METVVKSVWERAVLKLSRCPSCGSRTATARWAKGDDWFYVGCLECENKKLCNSADLLATMEDWEQKSKRRWRQA